MSDSHPEKVAGTLLVGTDGAGEVVVNYANLIMDKDGIGFLALSVDQARNLAKLLNIKADEAEKER